MRCCRCDADSDCRNPYSSCNPPEKKVIVDVCDLLMFIVGQSDALVEVSLQSARLCDIGAGHTYPNINQMIRK